MKDELDELDIPIKHESKPYLMIPFPDDATNGDIIKALLGKENVYIDKFSEEVNIYKNQVYIATIKRYWWDAPYNSKG